MTQFSNQATDTLLRMFATMRPAGSKAERRFIRDFILPLGVEQDERGNLYKRVGESAVLWSSHTDTVHRAGGTQKVHLTAQGELQLAKDSKATCLGADCTSGVWIMREMIQAGIPGLYVFHRAEEIGGLGSAYIATKTPILLQGIRFAIAFDRKGTQDVITHQGARCCSDEFAHSLAAELNVAGLKYQPDPTGSFTDTANYTDLIPECSNISVGYELAHSVMEHQDLNHLFALREAMMLFNEANLVERRNVNDPVEYDDSWKRKDWTKLYYGKKESSFTLDDYDSWRPRKTKRNESAVDIVKIIRENPHLVLDYLESYGITETDIAAYVYDCGGVIHYE